VVASVALAERISRTPAHNLTGFSIKLKALAWGWEDDVEDHQIEQLHALARGWQGAHDGFGHGGGQPFAAASATRAVRLPGALSWSTVIAPLRSTSR
jgi:hypothetical protein